MIIINDLRHGDFGENTCNIGSNVKLLRSKIEIKGKNNKIILGDGCKLIDCSISFYADNSTFSIGRSSAFRGVAKIGLESHIFLGSDITITSNLKIYCSEYTKVAVGNDCMFGDAVRIFSHDFHPIFDLHSGQRINLSQNVSVGNHVWLANGASLMKGASVGDGSVIGAEAVVTSAIPSHVIAAGNPARIVREEILWSRASLNTTSPFHFPDLLSLPEPLRPTRPDSQG